MKKTLDKKIKNIINGNYKYDDFIIADAKDADMGGGIPAPGNKRDKSGKLFNEYKNLDSYLKSIESITRSKLVDIMLMSASNAERLVQKGEFNSSVVDHNSGYATMKSVWPHLNFQLQNENYLGILFQFHQEFSR